MKITTPKQHQERQLHLRLTAVEEALIKAAAELQRLTISEFMLRSACASAEYRLADQQWERSIEAQDQPPADKPRLRRLFAETHVARRSS